jgi:hypothetical protein
MKVTGRPFCAQMPPATMVPLVKEYAVGAGLATPAAIEAGHQQMPGTVPCVTGIWVCDSPGPHH